jgi:hypothetical protein
MLKLIFVQSCPRLLEYGHTVEQGCSSIHKYLKDKNNKARDCQTHASHVRLMPLIPLCYKFLLATFVQSTAAEDTVGLVLEVSIPMLDIGVPMDWKVSLMDNPGFGETRECVTHLADASMVFSSAYIYLMQLEIVGGSEAAKFFTELRKIDKGKMESLYFGHF